MMLVRGLHVYNTLIAGMYYCNRRSLFSFLKPVLLAQACVMTSFITGTLEA